MKKIIIFMTLLAIMGIFAGCGKEKTQEEKPQLVKTMVAGDLSQEEQGLYHGTVHGRHETQLSFQVGGRLLSRKIQAGDMVSAGDELLIIDSNDIQQQSNIGEAMVRAAKAQLDLATTDLNRYRLLYEQNAVPARVLDQYQASYDSARASYEQAVAQSNQGHNALGYTRITAPFSGVISSVNAEIGQVIGAGQPVATLVQTGELEVEISIPEQEIDHYKIGQAAEITFWSLKDKKVKGFIRELSPMADKVTGTYRARISLQELPTEVRLGMTAKVRLAGGSHRSVERLQLPLSAIYQVEDTPMVWIVNKEDMTLSLKAITVEKFGKDTVYIDGIDSGSQVVVAGVHKLREGMKVRLAEEVE